MAIEFSKADREALSATLDRILAAYGTGATTVEDARVALAHLILAAARGDERELRGWLLPETIDIWEAGF